MQIKWNTLTFVGNNQHLFHFELNFIVKTDLSIFFNLQNKKKTNKTLCVCMIRNVLCVFCFSFNIIYFEKRKIKMENRIVCFLLIKFLFKMILDYTFPIFDEIISRSHRSVWQYLLSIFLA